MNKNFFPFWILFAGVTTFLGVKSYLQVTKELGIILGLSGLFGLYMALEIIRKHKDFRLTGNILKIRQYFRGEKEINLETLKGWKERETPYRGQANRKLFLTMESGQRVVLSDKDDLLEFEKLYHHLRVNFPDILKNRIKNTKKHSATPSESKSSMI